LLPISQAVMLWCKQKIQFQLKITIYQPEHIIFDVLNTFPNSTNIHEQENLVKFPNKQMNQITEDLLYTWSAINIKNSIQKGAMAVTVIRHGSLWVIITKYGSLWVIVIKYGSLSSNIVNL